VEQRRAEAAWIWWSGEVMTYITFLQEA